MASVETAILQYWYPGQHTQWIEMIAHPPRGGPYTRLMEEERVAWDKWERRNHDAARLTLVVMAHYASPVNSEQALTYLAVSTIAGLIDRQVRQAQYILRRLEEAGELSHYACDGACGVEHGQTHHWIIPRPPDCPPEQWGSTRPPRRRKRRTRTRGGAAA